MNVLAPKTIGEDRDADSGLQYGFQQKGSSNPSGVLFLIRLEVRSSLGFAS